MVSDGELTASSVAGCTKLYGVLVVASAVVPVVVAAGGCGGGVTMAAGASTITVRVVSARMVIGVEVEKI